MSQGVSVNASMLLALVSKPAIGDTVAQGHYLVLFRSRSPDGWA